MKSLTTKNKIALVSQMKSIQKRLIQLTKKIEKVI